MGIEVIYWERRDAADRNEMGQAALGLCRAQKVLDGVEDSRFYWRTPDQLVIQIHTSKNVDWSKPDPKVAASLFHLADLARQTGSENWMEPSTGLDNYRAAGRAD
ncbi:MAG: hypothetical protein R3320_13395 [Nitriliruptorales bacterium]|nr:hypothetical protein [Nitriliruptorales bacterium]